MSVDVTTLPYHDAVNLFPAMIGPEYDGFERSIRKSGIEVPVVVWRHPKKGMMVIDGRNRVDVAKKLNAENHLVNGSPLVVPFEIFEGKEEEIYDKVLRRNRDHRHLSSGQRAAISVKATYLSLKCAKKKPPKDSGDFAEAIAREAGTNRTYVFECQKLYLESPDLLDVVASGNVTIPKAMAILAERRAALTEPVQAEDPTAPATEGNDTPSVSTPETVPVVYDGEKNPVEPQFVHIFVMRDVFADTVRQINKLILTVEELKVSPGGAHLQDDVVIADLKAVVSHLKDEQPHIVCPGCSGTGHMPGKKKSVCTICKGFNFVGKSQAKAAKKSATSAPVHKDEEILDTVIEPAE